MWSHSTYIEKEKTRLQNGKDKKKQSKTKRRDKQHETKHNKTKKDKIDKRRGDTTIKQDTPTAKKDKDP
jgi:hypothetical protein